MKALTGAAGLLAVTALLSSAVPAQEVDPRLGAEAVMRLVFDRLDCDMDGIIDPGEVDEHMSQLWLPIDIDRSRGLDSREYAMTHLPVEAPIGAFLFADADADGDGVVGADEFRAHIKRMITALDDNGDREIARKDAGLRPFPQFTSRRLSFSSGRAAE